MGLFVRPLNEGGLASFQIAWIRCASAALILVAFTLVRDPKALRFRLRDIWCFLGTGLASVVFFTVCYYTTISLTSLSVAVVLLYTSPVFVLVLSRLLFGERITWHKVLAVILAVVGCAFASGIVSGTPQLSPHGLLIGIGSGFGYALYSIFSRYALMRGYKPLTISTWTFIFASLGCLPFANPVSTVTVLAAQAQLLWPVLGLALVATVVPFALYTIGLQYVENGRASVIVSVEIVMAAFIGFLVFGESLAWFNALGIAMVIGAVALIGLTSQSR